MKVIEKIREAREQEESRGKKVIFSFEFMAPRNKEEEKTLLKKIDHMVIHTPLFCDFTWRGDDSSTSDLTIETAIKMQNTFGVDTMMHLTCTQITAKRIEQVLDTIKSNGIKNVLALRGDPPRGYDKFVNTPGGFSSALQLVKHIKSKYGDYFGITVAGYPEGHKDLIGSDGVITAEDYEKDLIYLKRKVDAGADLIITQLFYDTDVYLKFVNDCSQIGITCPIIPGILPFSTYKGFLNITRLCKAKIPAEVTAVLESIKDNDEAVESYGVHVATNICKRILHHGINMLHLYTYKKAETTLAVLMNLGLIENNKISLSLPTRHIDRPNSYKSRAELHADGQKLDEEWVCALKNR